MQHLTLEDCKGDCVKSCTVEEEGVDFGCFLSCVEKCDDDDDDDYPPILTGLPRSLCINM